MVVDCSVIVTVQPTNGTADDKVEELLFPDRHNVTLPLNGLNILFNTCETAFNHTTQIAPDRCEYNNVFILGAGIASITCFFQQFFLDFDGWSHLSAIEQNFNPSATDVTQKQKRGNPVLKSPHLSPPTIRTLERTSSPRLPPPRHQSHEKRRIDFLLDASFFSEATRNC